MNDLDGKKSYFDVFDVGLVMVEVFYFICVFVYFYFKYLREGWRVWVLRFSIVNDLFFRL